MADTDPVQRLQMTEYSPDITGWDVDSLCSPTSPPEDKEYHVLVKQGASILWTYAIVTKQAITKSNFH